MNPATTRAPATRTRSLLVVEQGFLKPRKGKVVHGVELFRLHLMRQLIDRGVQVTVVAERSWRATIEAALGAGRASLVLAPPVAGVPGAGMIGVTRARRARREGFDTVLFGNARLGLVPAMHYAAWTEMGRRLLLFAHRDPGANFLDAVGTVSFDTVANSEWVASWYRGQTSGRVGVFYGLANADRFYPSPDRAGRADTLVHFVLLGRLPNISKGVEKAIAALNMLPDEVRARCRLHLASYRDPPDFGDPCIVGHRWMDADRVPQFLRTMDAMLAVSTHETFSQAIVQGMLTGLPIVSSAIPVYVEKIDPEAGGAGGVITRSTAEVARAMEALALDADLRRRLGEEGRRVALERFVWDTDRFVREHLFPE